jgi:hypothetical protein
MNKARETLAGAKSLAADVKASSSQSINHAQGLSAARIKVHPLIPKNYE